MATKAVNSGTKAAAKKPAATGKGGAKAKNATAPPIKNKATGGGIKKAGVKTPTKRAKS